MSVLNKQTLAIIGHYLTWIPQIRRINHFKLNLNSSKYTLESNHTEDDSRDTLNNNITGFLIHNSHTNQFIYVKCTVQWFLAYPQICTTITTDKEVGGVGRKKKGREAGWRRKVRKRVERDLVAHRLWPLSRYLLWQDFSLFPMVVELDLPGCQINSLPK